MTRAGRLHHRLSVTIGSMALTAALLILPGVAAGQIVTDRPTLALSDGWRFKFDKAVVGAAQPGFDDARWSTVSVPHTWNRVGYYRSDPQSHQNTAGTIDKTQGIGWYRLTFVPPPSFGGKRAWLEFDAASRIASVWLNGVELGQHDGGFSRFRLDATAALRPNQPNVLAVKVDNSKPEPGGTTADVLPLTGDFFVYGGLYRPVRLVATNAVHLDMLDHGGPGVYATTTRIDGPKASVSVRARLRNDGVATAAVRVVARLEDKAGKVAARTVLPISMRAQADGAIGGTLQLASVHPWNGIPDPYLYTLVVEVTDAKGRVLDRLAQPFGVRQIRIDPAKGLLLNGKAYPLHGVGYHQGREGAGWATNAADTEDDLKTLREMGANTIRLTHYQHGLPVHELADRLGFIVWDEIPLVSQWTIGGAKTASPGLLANARQQLAEIVRQNGNFASVATWGIANEVDFGNSLPGFITNSAGAPADPKPLLRELNQLAHTLDPSRPTTIATCCEGRLFAAGVDVPITATATDIAGANRYYGWYYGKAEELGPSLDALRAKRPEQPLALTEYGAGGAINIHTDNPDGAPADSRGRMQPEEVESLVHERSWAELRTRPYLWATWLWAAFDFASTVRHEGDSEDINTKGLITYDHKIRKDAFYFYKANWSTESTVHVTGSRYVDRAYPVVDVRVYSNAPRTTLTVNGRAMGTPACAERVCVWKSVRLAAGDNDVAAAGVFTTRTVVDRVTWRLADDVAHSVRIDAGTLVAAKGAHGRFGSDNYFIGGEAGSVDKPADYGKPQVATPIAKTDERDIAATFRRGSFDYRVPLEPGRYSVTLTFVEPDAIPGERVFDVAANGVPVIAGLDIASAAGGAAIAVQRTFQVAAVDNALNLAFRPTKGQAVVSAIEIVPDR